MLYFLEDISSKTAAMILQRLCVLKAMQKSLQKAIFFLAPFGRKGSIMPSSSCTTERLTVPPTFCFNFFKHLEEQKRAFDHGKSLTITAGLQRLSSIRSLGEMLQGPDTCMQTECKIESEKEGDETAGWRRRKTETWNGNMKRVRESANILGAQFRRLPATQQEDKYKEEEDIHL